MAFLSGLLRLWAISLELRVQAGTRNEQRQWRGSFGGNVWQLDPRLAAPRMARRAVRAALAPAAPVVAEWAAFRARSAVPRAAAWEAALRAEPGAALRLGAAGAAKGGAAGSDDPLTIFDGRCGQGWAASGSAPNLQGSVTPQVDSAGNWSFSFGRYRFVVAAARGGRIVEFSIDGNNLIDPTEGSTFWPSPQQAFTWPPPAEIDSAAYAAQAEGTSLSLTSKIAKTLNLSVRKRFSVNAASGIVSIEYQLVNESTSQSAPWAPWEVTRVRAGGYTFAPKGPGNRTITEDFPPLPLTLLPPAPGRKRYRVAELSQPHSDSRQLHHRVRWRRGLAGARQ